MYVSYVLVPGRYFSFPWKGKGKYQYQYQYIRHTVSSSRLLMNGYMIWALGVGVDGGLVWVTLMVGHQ